MEGVREALAEENDKYAAGCYALLEVMSEDTEGSEFNRTVPVGKDIPEPVILSDAEGSPLVTLSPCGIPVDMGSPISPLRMPPQYGMPEFNLESEGIDRSVSKDNLIQTRKGPHPPSPPPPTFYSPLQARMGRKSKVPTPLRAIEKNIKREEETLMGCGAMRDSIKEKIFKGGTPSVSLLAQKVRDGVVKKIVVVMGPNASHSGRYEQGAGPPVLSLELDKTTLPGLQEELDLLKLPSLRAAHDERIYRADYSLLCSVWRELWPNAAVKPLLTHFFCKMLHNKGLLSRVYTVNLEGLERSAGLPRSKVVEIGGTFNSAHCVECGREHMATFMKEKLFKRQRPTCTNKACKGLVKPDVVMSRSKRTPPNSKISTEDFESADCVFLIGFSEKSRLLDHVLNNIPDLTPRIFLGSLTIKEPYEHTDDELERDVFLENSEDAIIQICREADLEGGLKESMPPNMLKRVMCKLNQGWHDVVRSMPVVKDGILRPTVITTPNVVSVKKAAKIYPGKVSPSKKQSPLKVFSFVSDFNKTICSAMGNNNRLPRSSSAGNNNLIRTPPCLKPLSAPSSSLASKRVVVSFVLPGDTDSDKDHVSPKGLRELPSFSSSPSSVATLSPMATPSMPFSVLPPLNTPTHQSMRKCGSGRCLSPLALASSR